MPAESPSHINKDDLEQILQLLPEDREGKERRKYSLTRDDVTILMSLMQMMQPQHSCILLDTEQSNALASLDAESIRDISVMVKERRRLLRLVGLMVLAVLGYVGKAALAAMDFNWVARLFGYSKTGG